MLARQAILWLALALALPALAQRSFQPVDEATAQPDFVRFRAEWLAALARRDSKFVVAHVHPDVRISFGDDNGIAKFAQQWRLENPASSFWNAMGGVLALGGSFDAGGNFTAPYVFSRWPEDLESFSHVAIVRKRVRIRARPAARSPALMTVDPIIVQALPTARANPDWIRIRAPGGKTGYVARADARSPLDYRAVFTKSEGRWLLTAFVAGD